MRYQQQIQSALALTILAGSAASAAVTVDGKITAGDNYGPAKWVNTVPTGFGDNVSGSGGAAGAGATVRTGVELAIPYSSIGYTPGSALKMSVFITGGGGFFSNQFLPQLPLNTDNLGGNERARDMNLIDGNQFVSFTPSNVATAPLVDGFMDGSTPTATGLYGTALAIQGNFTQFGDSNTANPVSSGNGSEADGLYVVRNDATSTLYVMVTGNLENNGNRLNIFFDTVAGGQQRLETTTGWTGLLDTLSAAPGQTDGFTFDVGFEADYGLSVSCVNADTNAVPPTPARIFVNFASFPTAAPGVANYSGFSLFPPFGAAPDFLLPANFNAGPLDPDTANTGTGTPAVRIAIDNRNTAGVLGTPVAVGPAVAPSVDLAYGSEINGVYSKIESGRLFVLITGNLETNFNKMSLFFDVGPGGQNRLRGPSRILKKDPAPSGSPYDANTTVYVPGLIADSRYVGNTTGDFNGLQNMAADNAGFVVDPNDNTQAIVTSGLKFDADFAADYWLAVGNGGQNSADPLGTVSMFVNSAVLRTNGRREPFDTNTSTYILQDYRAFDGGLKNGNPSAPTNPTLPNPIDFAGPTNDPLVDPFGGPIAGDKATNYGPRRSADIMLSPTGVPVSNLIIAKLDNSNIGGVTGTTASAAAAAAVTTGLELSIDLDELGWDGSSDIKLAGFVANGGYGFMSNQIIGNSWNGTGTAPGNAGNTRNVDFSSAAYPGNQWVNLTAAANPCPNLSNVAGPNQSTTPDGALTADDIIVFLGWYFAGDNRANVAGANQSTVPDNALTADDIIVFLGRYFAGC